MNHVVDRGDCVLSISAHHGLSWETVWNHPANADLKARRTNPTVLQPGDVLFVPEKEEKTVACATGAVHRFVVHTSPATINVKLTLDDQPRAGLPFALYIDDELVVEGTTDGKGFVRATVPPRASAGRLELRDGEIVDVYHLSLGAIDPIDGDDGVRQRLQNLGFHDPDDPAAGVRAFQALEKLPVTGEVDAATRAALQEKYGV